MAKLETLPTFGDGGLINVIVETPRGSLIKCNYDSELDLFVLGKPLPHGLCYPFDWGFIPSTKGQDGDPLDAMVVHDAPCPVGCLIRCQPLAILRLTQSQKGKRERNDRLFLQPASDKIVKGQNILTDRLKRELEQFFAATILGTGKTLNFKGWKGAGETRAAIRQAVRS